MKKIALLVVFFLLSPTAHAVGVGGDCSVTACDAGLTCDFSIDPSMGICVVNAPTGTTPTPSTPGATPTGGFVPIAPIPGLTQGIDPSQPGGIANFLNNLYRFLVGLAAVITVIQIIRGGLLIATQDSVGKHSEGREMIQQALLGLVLVLSPVLVFSIINPGILNLSYSLKPIDQSGSTPAGNLAVTENPVVNPSTGCSEKGTVLRQATCPTINSANDFAANCGANWSGQVLPCQTVLANGSCGDTGYTAICSQTLGYHQFIDVSQAGWTYQGILNSITGYSKYEPVGSTPSNPKNGQEVVNFAAACATDGGTVCLSMNLFSTTCSYTGTQPVNQNNTCYDKTVTCMTDAAAFQSTQGCGKNLQFTIIP